MAEKKKAPAAPVKAESVYTAAELAKNHKILGTSYEIVIVALKKAKKKSATLSEAKKIIDNFKYKEVK